MNTKLLWLLLIPFFGIKLWAGSISGEITYSGSLGDSVVVAAFTTLDIFHNSPVNMKFLSAPGPYSLDDMSDGTYYIASLMSNDLDNLLITDPFGFYGTAENLTQVIISGNNDVTGINIILTDGTVENPNPFVEVIITPDKIIQLPETTVSGFNASLLFDGTNIFLYKHDYPGAPSAKIYVINPETGALLNTHYLALESSPNRISWIDKMVLRNGVLWACGGYGDPLGSGYIEGVFKMDIASSNSSSQIPLSPVFEHINGLACDGANFYALVDSNSVEGVVKFNPDQVSETPSSLFLGIDDWSKGFSYGNNFLWIGTNYLHKYDPVLGSLIETLDIPGSAAGLFFDGYFWAYDENDNTLKAYSLLTLGINSKNENGIPVNFSLTQNYPNPFNPGTTISFSLPSKLFVSLKVFDTLGREVSVLVSEELSAGTYSRAWDAQTLPSGIYFYRLQTADFTETRRMILMK